MLGNTAGRMQTGLPKSERAVAGVIAGLLASGLLFGFSGTAQEAHAAPEDVGVGFADSGSPDLPASGGEDSAASPDRNPGELNVEDEHDVTDLIYRLYNPNSGEHFYTANWNEVWALNRVGWRYEGVGWVAPSDLVSCACVFRLYNSNAGEHFYTASEDECAALVAAGWSDEGIAWYSDETREVPIFREYNPNMPANNHNYTASRGEHEYLLMLGWRDEGVAWYAY